MEMDVMRITDGLLGRVFGYKSFNLTCSLLRDLSGVREWETSQHKHISHKFQTSCHLYTKQCRINDVQYTLTEVFLLT